MEGTQRIKEILEAGVIGPVSEVHVWTNRPSWPQGVPRPTTERLRTTTANPMVGPAPAAQAPQGAAQQAQPLVTSFAGPGRINNIQQPLAAAMAAGLSSPPPGMDWELYIGPAPMVPYSPMYHPFSWRGWVDFGIGALGDMGAHLIDAPVYGLDLDLPTSIEATSTPFGLDVDDTPATWPVATMVHYEFAGRGARPPVQLTWYDGGLMPQRPRYLPDDVTLLRGGGGYFVGTKGILMYDTYGNNPRLYPESLTAEAERVPRSIARVPVPQVEGGSVGPPLHILNWVDGIKGTARPTSSFDYATRLNETMILGLVALRTGQGRKVIYDGANMRITNIPEANQLLTREYRAGWTL